MVTWYQPPLTVPEAVTDSDGDSTATTPLDVLGPERMFTHVVAVIVVVALATPATTSPVVPSIAKAMQPPTTAFVNLPARFTVSPKSSVCCTAPTRPVPGTVDACEPACRKRFLWFCSGMSSRHAGELLDIAAV